MGRPSTPAPEDRGGGGKAGSAAWLLGLGLVSLVLSIIAVATPKWGSFSSQFGAGGSYNDGYFGITGNPCIYQNNIAYICDNLNYKLDITLTIGGVCAFVGLAFTALFTVCAGLHCAMRVNNKEFVLKYKTNIFVALISIVLAELAIILSLGLVGSFLFGRHNTGYSTTMGFCYVIQIILGALNLILLVMCWMSHRKAKAVSFPRHSGPYEISGDRYEGGYDNHGGIAVTSTSGNQYPNQQAPPLHLQPPQYNQQFQGPYINGGAPQYNGVSGQFNGGGGGHYNGGGGGQYNGGYNPTGQFAQPQVSRAPLPTREGVSINLNPEGRVSYNQLKGPGAGSMDSLNSTQSSTMSTLSTGSFNSYNSNISNPIRSSLKKPKNKENQSIASGVSKKSGKSVSYGIGAEQTAV